VHIDLTVGGPHRCIDVAESMKGSEIPRKSCLCSDASDRLVKVLSLIPRLTGENKPALVLRCHPQNFLGNLANRDVLIHRPPRVLDRNGPVFEVNVIPAETEEGRASQHATFMALFEIQVLIENWRKD